MKWCRILLILISIGFTTHVAAQTVCITKTGKKYHTKSCHYLKYSKKEVALEDAIKFGYEACLVCKPSTKVNSEEKSQLTETRKTSNRPPPQRKSNVSQCTGTTKSGSRCKRKTKNTSGRCYQH
ncbi:MAG: hypothetical protein JKY22_10465 [Flavobacteriaceae bacterium]|nr:hypothetical protein [Flavobacteriaceae bacterium]